MIPYRSNEKGPKKLNVYLDPDDKTIVNTFYGLNKWAASTVYKQGDAIVPNLENGYFYKCIINGKSSTTEPNWTLIDDYNQMKDGTVIWESVPYNLWLNSDETITNSVWLVIPNTVQLNYSAFDNVSASIMIESMPSDIESIILTNHVTKSNGESLSKSFEYKINQQ